MCTVTWLHEPGGYRLFFNRDESRTRGPATPPAVRERNGVRYLAALDSDFGGSWLAVNEFGLSVGLLNGYAAADLREPPGGYISRGLLLTSLADAADAAQVMQTVRRIDLAAYRTFVLVAIDARGARIARWGRDGLRCEEDRSRVDSLLPLVSSAFDLEGVRRSRETLFRARRAAAGSNAVAAYLTFHRSHEPASGPYSPCMHRSDAETVSFSLVRVGRERIELVYLADSPCRDPTGAAASRLGLARTDGKPPADSPL